MRGILGFIVIVLILWALILFLNIPFNLYKSFKVHSEKTNNQYKEEEEEQQKDDHKSI